MTEEQLNKLADITNALRSLNSNIKELEGYIRDLKEHPDRLFLGYDKMKFRPMRLTEKLAMGFAKVLEDYLSELKDEFEKA